MFRTDLTSIIRSLNSIYTATGIRYANYVSCLLPMYSVETPDDGQQICRKHVVFFIKINLRNSASLWLLLEEYITMHASPSGRAV